MPTMVCSVPLSLFLNILRTFDGYPPGRIELLFPNHGREKYYSKSDIRKVIGDLLDFEADKFLKVPEEKFWLEFKELDKVA